MTDMMSSICLVVVSCYDDDGFAFCFSVFHHDGLVSLVAKEFRNTVL